MSCDHGIWNDTRFLIEGGESRSRSLARVSEARLKVAVLLGTRPEAIKLAPIVRELDRRASRIATRVCSSGQHREMVQQVVDAVGLRIDVQLDVMTAGATLGSLTSRLFENLDRLLAAETPDWVVVQGDTTTAMVGAMSAFYRRVCVAHVEAGLRTYDRWSPFPEEINRSIIGSVADLHFAPTLRAVENLRRAGVEDRAIVLSGNPVVDSLLWTLRDMGSEIPLELRAEVADFVVGKRLVLATSHRRESLGKGLESICQALLDVVEAQSDAVVVFPVHLNPEVWGPVHRLLGDHPRVKLVPPVGYGALVWLMKNCFCIVTDSGGLQEEAPTLGKPVMIVRDATERPEVVEAGCGRLVGTDRSSIFAGVSELFDSPSCYRSMSEVLNPFGDGHAAERIADALEASQPGGKAQSHNSPQARF